MSHDFDVPADRRGTDSLKWERYAGREILPLWVADMDFRAPPAVLEALRRRIDHGVFGYTLATRRLSEALAAWMGGAFGWSPDPAHVLWIPGVNYGMHLASLLAGEAGDEVLTLTPVYPPFFDAPAGADRRLVRVPLARVRPGRWEIDWERLEAACTPRTRLLQFCHPHNPVGRCWSRAELERVAEFAARRGLLVVSDEIHLGLVLEPGLAHLPYASLGAEVAARSITLLAPTKTFNIPGLCACAAIVPDAELRRRFQAAHRVHHLEQNTLALAATEAAFVHGESWRRELLAYLRGNRDHLRARLAAEAPAVVCAEVEATYLAWLDVTRLGWEDPVGRLERHGLGLSDGRPFDGAGFVRLNFGCPRATLDLAIDRFVAAVKGSG